MLNCNSDSDLKKALLGQFYTTSNPFSESEAFEEWWEKVPKEGHILEPFAGGGNLFDYIQAPWKGYDIDPQHPSVAYRDTMLSFPEGYEVCITNPPYLAKTTVSRKKMDKKLKYEDLYLDCLEKCLENCSYVAAIIPSTFFATKKFRKRLFAWDKIDKSIFSSTLNPAGVGYWVPEEVDETKIFVNGTELTFDQKEHSPSRASVGMTFNDKDGNIVLSAIDTTRAHNIKVKGIENFDTKKYLKHTSRNYSLIKCDELTADDFDEVNLMIEDWRKETKDFYLTSFKSLMKDQQKYRKRIGFSQFKWIVEKFLNRKELR